MFEVDPEIFALIFISAGVSLVFGLWLFYERRDIRRYSSSVIRHVYHCIRCGRLYYSRRNEEVQPCPQCSFENDRLRF